LVGHEFLAGDSAVLVGIDIPAGFDIAQSAGKTSRGEGDEAGAPSADEDSGAEAAPLVRVERREYLLLKGIPFCFWYLAIGIGVDVVHDLLASKSTRIAAGGEVAGFASGGEG